MEQGSSGRSEENYFITGSIKGKNSLSSLLYSLGRLINQCVTDSTRRVGSIIPKFIYSRSRSSFHRTYVIRIVTLRIAHRLTRSFAQTHRTSSRNRSTPFHPNLRHRLFRTIPLPPPHLLPRSNNHFETRSFGVGRFDHGVELVEVVESESNR